MNVKILMRKLVYLALIVNSVEIPHIRIWCV